MCLVIENYVLFVDVVFYCVGIKFLGGIGQVCFFCIIVDRSFMDVEFFIVVFMVLLQLLDSCFGVLDILDYLQFDLV